MTAKYIDRPWEKIATELTPKELHDAFYVLSMLGVDNIIIDNYGLKELQMQNNIGYSGLLRQLMPYMGVTIHCNGKDRSTDA
jgi:hypothetical protein